MKPTSFLAILSLITIQALVFSACGPTEKEQQPIATTDTPLTLSVDMPCDGCIAKVKGKLGQVEGLKIIDIQRGKQDNLRLAYKADKTSPEAIKKALSEIGKPAH